MSGELRDQIAARLTRIHFDGMGCGTHGINACSNCHGPSPMSAREIADEIVRLLPESGE